MALENESVERDLMMRALELAERGRGRTSPNPVVGAVLVRDGRIVGEGWHRAIGLAHAEAEAIARAGARARGATLYVTLEPCAHQGRTPPCVDAVIQAGVRRCVVATRDPHSIVNGRGLRRLRRAGIEVSVGLCADVARRALGGYWLAHTQQRPRVTWKVAATLDGRIADRRGRSRWITGAEARARGHALRARADAILIGSRTARLDDPRLTVRAVRSTRAPLRVVCDSNLDLPGRLRLLRAPLARGTVVACTRRAPAARQRTLERRGLAVWRLAATAGGVSPAALARRLVREGCHDVLLEGGARLGSSWLRAGLVDRIAMFVAPRVLGGDGASWCEPLGLVLGRAIRGDIVEQRRIGADTFLVVELRR